MAMMPTPMHLNIMVFLKQKKECYPMAITAYTGICHELTTGTVFIKNLITGCRTIMKRRLYVGNIIIYFNAGKDNDID